MSIVIKPKKYCWNCGVLVDSEESDSKLYCSDVCYELSLGKEIWRHYKGFSYRVIAVARLESDRTTQMVVYTDFQKNHKWIRPLNEFLEKFTAEYSNG